MNWIRIATGIMDDPAVLGLSEALGVSPPLTTGCLVGVLTHLPEHARTGDLSGISDLTVERWAQWPGKRGKFAQAFRTYLCDPQGVVRAWEKHNGAALREADRAKARVKEWRENRKNGRNVRGNVRGTEAITNGERTRLRDGTGRNELLTATDNNIANDAAAPSRPKKAKPKAAPKWPDWEKPARDELYERWRSTLGQVGYEKWVTGVGPVIGGGVDGFTREQLVAGYSAWLSSAGHGGSSSPFLSPAKCGQQLAAAARIQRDHPPGVARADAMDRLVHGRVAA